MTILHSIFGLAIAGSIGCASVSSSLPPTYGPVVAQGALSREVTFKVPDMTLEGTLLLPQGSTGKVPAILLLPGSGPTDRDGNSALGIKTDVLKQIAEKLAANGIATLRFDKRAIRHYSSNWPKTVPELSKFFDWDHFVGDAEAGFDFLAKQPEIDETRVGILGHSEGAIISLQIGADRAGKPGAPKITISLGGTGRPMGIILHEQIARQVKKAGLNDAQQKVYVDYTDAACQALVDGKPLPPNPPQGLGALFNPTAIDLMRSYCRIDPSELAKKVQGPVLVVNGAHDTQVSAERDTPKLIAALKSRQGGLMDSLIVPDTSHNLKSTKSGNDDAFDGPVVPEALDKIVQFAKANL